MLILGHNVGKGVQATRAVLADVVHLILELVHDCFGVEMLVD